jgi:hypothetical protein
LGWISNRIQSVNDPDCITGRDFGAVIQIGGGSLVFLCHSKLTFWWFVLISTASLF